MSEDKLVEREKTLPKEERALGATVLEQLLCAAGAAALCS